VFDTEIIAQGVAKGMVIREVPIRTRYFDEASQVGFWRGTRYGLAILKTMVPLQAALRRGIYSASIFRDGETRSQKPEEVVSWLMADRASLGQPCSSNH